MRYFVQFVRFWRFYSNISQYQSVRYFVQFKQFGMIFQHLTSLTSVPSASAGRFLSIFFSFWGIPKYGEGGGGGASRVGQIPNFYQKFVLKASLNTFFWDIKTRLNVALKEHLHSIKILKNIYLWEWLTRRGFIWETNCFARCLEIKSLYCFNLIESDFLRTFAFM